MEVDAANVSLNAYGTPVACLVADTRLEVSLMAVENLRATGEGPSRAPQQNIYYKTEGCNRIKFVVVPPNQNIFHVTITKLAPNYKS
jgi:hypothetical protein